MKLIKIFNYLTIISITAFLVLGLLIRLDVTNSVYGYIFSYVVFPLLLFYIIILAFLLKNKKYVQLKKMSLKFFLWILILAVGWLLIYYFVKK